MCVIVMWRHVRDVNRDVRRDVMRDVRDRDVASCA